MSGQKPLQGIREKKDSPVRTEAAFKQSLAMRLRVKGYDYATIAEKMGLGSNASAAYQIVLRGIRTVRLESAEEMRDVEITRLDSLNALGWKAIQRASRRGDTKGVATALNALVRLSDRRAKLMGLDAPVKYDLLMSEARKMASQLNMPETEFMALCETVAADAWGK
jgi:hypothetical protein